MASSRVWPNAVIEKKSHLILTLLGKFWAPVPWMLEATIVLEFALGRFTEGIVIAVLLVSNASLGLFQETRARSAVELLQKRLAVRARILRDDIWGVISAEELVPGDFGLTPSKYPTDRLVSAGKEGRHEASTV